MADSDVELGRLTARVDAMEKAQDHMEARQERILTAVTAIQQQLDKAAGGASVIRWALGFFGLTTIAGCIALAVQVRSLFDRG